MTPPSPVPPPPPYAWAAHAQHMGQLARGGRETAWEVYLETAQEELGLVRGRVHFVQGDRGGSHRESGWIFMDRTDREVMARFNEFGATELWQLLESLSP